MKNLTLANIAKACGGVYHGPENKKDIQVSSITTDSRQIQPEGLFVPIAGERVDGHTFIPQVMEKGALATLSERPLEGAQYPYIQVQSSLQAVKDIAEFYRQQLSLRVTQPRGAYQEVQRGHADVVDDGVVEQNGLRVRGGVVAGEDLR